MPRSSRCNRLPGVTTIDRPHPTIPAFIDTALVPARGRLSDTDAIKQMASDMREAGFREGGMTRDALSLKGWTSAQIDRLGTKARERAQRDAVVSL